MWCWNKEWNLLYQVSWLSFKRLNILINLINLGKNVLKKAGPTTGAVLKDTEYAAPVRYTLFYVSISIYFYILVIARCGQTIAENNTYFESQGSESGNCALKICPCSDNICQLRLDFDNFVITGPSTVTDTIGNSANGMLAAAGQATTNAGRCLTDTFAVTSGSTAPPAICGTNTGQHMYVDANQACNDLAFLLGNTADGTTLATRSWSIRVTQYDCGSPNLAPSGCVQYFYGVQNDIIQSYNYGGGYHLADQRQKICFRREKGNCKICYSSVSSIADLEISGAIDAKQYTKSCCSYKADGMGSNYDCLQIPSLLTTKGKQLNFNGNAICGMGGISSKSEVVTAANQKTLCTVKQPFMLNFQTDTFDLKAEADAMNKGFQLAFIQSSSNC